MSSPLPSPFPVMPSFMHEPPERVWLGDDLPDTHAEDTYAREHNRLVEARPPQGVDGSVFPC